uniref:PilZ domain-containing protein n=1 Tax=Magnetococcus massalia (strain MO-1) TaxID=451514 RepID=A0A1S7LF24_MAGMO|nr:protein of unknown function[Include PilZ domain] [Candidatus Magnetococcus massalia]
MLSVVRKEGQGRSGNLDYENAEKLESPEEVASLIAAWAQAGSSVFVRLNSSDTPYSTLFVKPDAYENVEYQDGGFLLEPLYPPIGNLKVRNQSSILLEVSYDSYIYHVNVPYNGVCYHEDGRRMLELGIPAPIPRWSQMRSNRRVPCPGSCSLTLEIKRPSGLSFEVPLRDISMGGLSCWYPKNQAKFSEGAKVKCIITSLTMPKPLEINGRILRNHSRGHGTYMRIFFDENARSIQKRISMVVDGVHKGRSQSRKRLLGL